MKRAARRQAVTVPRLLAGLALAVAGATPAAGQQGVQAPDATAAYKRSLDYERVQDYQNAIRALAPVYEAAPNGYTVNLRMGWLFYLNGNHANAAEHYEVATRAAPLALEPKLGHLLPLLAQGRWSDAETLAYQVVSADHYNYYGNLRLAIALRMQGKLDAAYQIALKMVGAYPADLLHLTELAQIQDARGDKAEARRIFGEVLLLDPEHQTARRYLGR
jgi:tetratricopeptide (TPR) repeat protein